jgi:glycosyltransferase involved in cell wall biosynthesis
VVAPSGKSSKQRMKITFLVPHPVSYRLDLFELLAACPEIELRVLYCATDSGTRTPSPFMDRSRRYTSIVLRGWSIGTPKVVGFPLYVNPSIVRWVSRNRTEVLVVAGYSYPTAVAAAALGAWRRLPWVLLSDSFSLSARHSRGAYGRLRRSLVRGLMRRAGAVIVPGVTHIQDLVAEGVPPQKIFRYHLAANLSPWVQSPASIRQEHPSRSAGCALHSHSGGIITTIARLVPEKDVGTLIRGFASFFPTHRDWCLHVIGGGPEYPRLLALTSRLGVPNVLFQGPMERDQVAQALHRSSIFALTSRLEPWGVAVTEALSVGLPCVLTSRVGASELIAGTQAGRIVREGDPEAVASALAHFADMDDAGEVRAAAQEIAQSYSVAGGIPAILRACERAIASHS